MLRRTFQVDSRKVIVVVSATIFALVGINLFFSVIQKNNSISNLKRVEAIFQNDEIGTNPYLVMKDLMEMQERKLITCISITEKYPVVEQFVRNTYSNCATSVVTLNAKTVSSSLRAGNGSTWEVSFNSNNPEGFSELLWLVRALVVSAIIFFFVALEQNEKRVTEKQKLELEHQRKLSTMAREVAHDIRSPLSALKIALHPGDNVEERNALAKSAIVRIESIAQDLLDRTREKTKIKTSEVKSFVDEIVNEFDSRFENLEVTTQSHLRFDKQLSIDKPTVQRILSNIFQNSLEAKSHDTKISVKLSDQKEALEISISDNGPGFPKNYSVENSRSINKPNGNGLGLSQVIRIISEVKGKVEVENLEPSGARVTLQIPTIS